MTESRFRFDSAVLVRRSVLHHLRVYAAVMLGVAAGTAVLVGALLVGDSVRGSLRDLVLQRLGRVDVVLQAPRFFRAELARELAGDQELKPHYQNVLPAVLLQGTVQQPDSGRLSSRVQLLGIPPEFWSLGPLDVPVKHPKADQIVLNDSLARTLGVQQGQDVLVRLRRATLVPEETPFGRKEEAVETMRLQVVQIIPSRGLGRFGLRPNQQLPLNAYLALETMQQLVQQPGRANLLLFAGNHAIEQEPDPRAFATLQRRLRFQLADFGLRIEKTPRGYFQLVSDRLLLEPAVEQAAAEAFAGLKTQRAFTYLANWISAAEGKARIPYSTVTALDFSVATPPLGPWRTTDGQVIDRLGPEEILLNSWAFEDLNRQLQAAGAKPLRPGARIRLTYFPPEYTTAGKSKERTAQFRLRGVVPLEPDSPAADPNFTPEVPGLTDKESIEDWDAPFEFYQSRVRPVDEQYWDRYRATPKAFVSLAAGQRLWGTERFGRLTSVRIAPAQGLSVQELSRRLLQRLRPEALGFQLQPVKRQSLAASRGTTPFSVLFLSFSFFLIAGAAILVMLLFRLGVETRARQVGLLLATGFTRRQVMALLLREGATVAALGGLPGVLLGAGFAWLMLYGLRTWWVGAVGTPFLNFHSSWLSYAAGYASGVLLCFVAVWWGVRALRGVSIRRLLAGRSEPELASWQGRGRWALLAAMALLLAALGLAAAGLSLGGERQAPLFFGAGACVLGAGMVGLRYWITRGTRGRLVRPGPWPMLRLALGNAARNPSRTLWTVTLIAAAAFLVVAVNSFRIDPADRPPRKDSGDGGLALVAESLPIYRPLEDPAALQELGGLDQQQMKLLQGVRIYSFRVLPGEDASCRNLYQTTRPRVLGVPREFIRRGGFAWYASEAQTPEEKANPWLLLEKDWGTDPQGRPLVPVVLDMNTAMYSLHLYQVGTVFTITDSRGNQVPLRLVGMLSNSIFQGDVLMSRRRFEQQFPWITGFQFFAVEAPWQRVDQVQTLLERSLADLGFDAQRCSERLRQFLVVQNTYISTFAALGGLGLLLGTLGLAAVQLRNVLQRRGELALLRAVGFARGKLARLVNLENALLLAAGLLLGIVAAAVALVPHLVFGLARVPVALLAWILLGVLVAGLAAGAVAVVAVLRAPLIESLREEG